MSAREGIARGAGGRRPHRVGLVCLDAGEKGAARLLLDDLAAATDAYECRAGRGDDAIELLELRGGGAGVDALVVASAAGPRFATCRGTPGRRRRSTPS